MTYFTNNVKIDADEFFKVSQQFLLQRRPWLFDRCLPGWWVLVSLLPDKRNSPPLLPISSCSCGAPAGLCYRSRRHNQSRQTIADHTQNRFRPRSSFLMLVTTTRSRPPSTVAHTQPSSSPISSSSSPPNPRPLLSSPSMSPRWTGQIWKWSATWQRNDE